MALLAVHKTSLNKFFEHAYKDVGGRSRLEQAIE
jgi:hypothetical protein